jgi:hypothetical protein
MLRISPTTLSVRCAKRKCLNGPAEIAGLVFLLCLGARVAAAQGSAEYGLAVAGAAGNATGIAKTIGPALSSVAKATSTVPADKKLLAAPPVSVAPDAANRKALEKRAGKDAAKLTLKSVPSKASVRIDGKAVGQTPLLLTLAPGNYKIEMTGPRMEVGIKQVELRPQEARELELPLSAAPQYPTQIWLR